MERSGKRCRLQLPCLYVPCSPTQFCRLKSGKKTFKAKTSFIYTLLNTNLLLKHMIGPDSPFFQRIRIPSFFKKADPQPCLAPHMCCLFSVALNYQITVVRGVSGVCRGIYFATYIPLWEETEKTWEEREKNMTLWGKMLLGRK